MNKITQKDFSRLICHYIDCHSLIIMIDNLNLVLNHKSVD